MFNFMFPFACDFNGSFKFIFSFFIRSIQKSKMIFTQEYAESTTLIPFFVKHLTFLTSVPYPLRSV